MGHKEPAMAPDRILRALDALRIVDLLLAAGVEPDGRAEEELLHTMSSAISSARRHWRHKLAHGATVVTDQDLWPPLVRLVNTGSRTEDTA